MNRSFLLILFAFATASCIASLLPYPPKDSPLSKPGPYCSPLKCPKNQTCCERDDGSHLCCPYANATCCGVGDTCCPSGHSCDPVKGTCVPADNSTTCLGCQDAIKNIITRGCGAACSYLPPPAREICQYLSDAGFCQAIIQMIGLGRSPILICSTFGLCTGGTCKCGYCTRYLHGRCLSVPNHCPASHSPDPIEPAKSSFNGKFCWNGQCEAEHEGCCLTCF